MPYSLSKGFCWNEGDESTEEWVPQGITAGEVDHHRIWIVSWHNKDDSQARITILNDDQTKYRHLLLIDPAKGEKGTVGSVNAHAGGLALVGHHLYVADSGKGLRVFDLHHIWQGSGKHSQGYRYVLPQVGSYTYPKPATGPCKVDGKPYFSSISYDRSTRHRHLISGEFCGTKSSGRVVRWPLQEKHDLLKSPSKQKVPASDWHRTTLHTMQGVTARGSSITATTSGDGSKQGVWHRLTMARPTTRHRDGPARETHHYDAPAPGPEDVTYAHGRYWTLTEQPDKRYVFPNDAAQTISH